MSDPQNPFGGAPLPQGGTPLPPPPPPPPAPPSAQPIAPIPAQPIAPIPTQQYIPPAAPMAPATPVAQPLPAQSFPPVQDPYAQPGQAAPAGDMTGAAQQGGGAPTPPPPPGPPANFQLGAKLPAQLKVNLPAHSLTFDEAKFVRLLAGSISLTKDEKKRIVDSIPKLKQSQIDELIRIFEDEKRKFAELGAEHVSQLEKLAQKHYEDWMDIEMTQEHEQKSADDTKKAEELRRQLGLGGSSGPVAPSNGNGASGA